MNHEAIIKTTILNVITDMCLAREVDCDLIPVFLRDIADDWHEEAKNYKE